jgi:hypothetical protein
MSPAIILVSHFPSRAKETRVDIISRSSVELKRVNIYLYEGKILLPIVAIRAHGTLLETDPVAIFDVWGDRDRVVDAVGRRLMEALPRLDMIDDSVLDREPVARAVKVRSWKAFVKDARLWVLRNDVPGIMVLKATHPVYEFREFQEDEQPIRAWPGSVDPAIVAREAVELTLPSRT